MGAITLFSGGSSCTCQTQCSCPPPEPPNPNPFKYTIVAQEDRNGHSILVVDYEGCTTFDGRKLLLTRGVYKDNGKLDPHFLGGGHPVLARFEPTEEGVRLARLCADLLPEGNCPKGES